MEWRKIETIARLVSSGSYDHLMIEWDEVDRQMIVELQRDGRTTIPTLAERLGVSRATAYARFHRLLNTGVITGFTATVDHEQLGLGVAALVLVNVRQGAWRELQRELSDLPGVEWLGVATGPFDFVLLARAEDLVHLRDVVLQGVQAIDGVKGSQTIVLLDEIDRRLQPLTRQPLTDEDRRAGDS
jgi:DNA-binding Lrp family transcriptional regulator